MTAETLSAEFLAAKNDSSNLLNDSSFLAYNDVSFILFIKWGDVTLVYGYEKNYGVTLF